MSLVTGGKKGRKIKSICLFAVVTLVIVSLYRQEVDDLRIGDIVKRIDTWENGIRFAQWNNAAETDKEYLSDWFDTLEKLIKPGDGEFFYLNFCMLMMYRL